MTIRYIVFLFFIISCGTSKNIATQEVHDLIDYEKFVFALVKISYNEIGETPVEGGVSGTAFLLNDSTVMTANHVLNNLNFKPNLGYKYVQYWLLQRGKKNIIEITEDDIIPYPEIEASLIKIKKHQECIYDIESINASVKDSVYNYGHKINMPITKAHWEDKLVIDEYDLENSKSDSKGVILLIRELTVSSNDINILNKTCIQPSFIANVGMSGGPLISNNKIIGLMSFGLPPDSTFKKEVYAISIDEILKGTN